MACPLSFWHLLRHPARLRTVAVWGLAVTGILSLSGCSTRNDLPELGEVTGRITLDGQPLPHAQIQFLPASGRPSSAESNEDGRYRLQYTADEYGAVIGAHTVQIRTAVDGRDDLSTERLPARYHAKSKLRADVKPRDNEIDFDLLSK